MKLNATLLAASVLLLSCSTTIPDNPEIPIGEFSNEESQAILDQVNSQTGESKECIETFLKDYQRSLFDYCEATDGGKNIGGGCHHVAYAWSITASVLKASLTSCVST